MEKLQKYLAIALLLLFAACGSEDVEINNVSDYEVYIQEEMDGQGIPALATLIFKEDQILYEKYLGQSQIQQNIALQDNHLFLLASVSKVITATALLQLYDQGLFGLDDNINGYLPFNVTVPNQTTPITFRMLLTHTSAIADGDALDEQYFYGKDPDVALDFFLENYLVAGGSFYNANQNFYDFEPGSQHEYSNVGNALIGVLVEQISNKGFNAYCKENIFAPLGMTNTFWRLDEIFQANLTIVQPYNLSRNNYEAIDHYTFTDYPNGGLRSTAQDLFKFLSAFAQGGTSNNFQLLKSSTVSEMASLQIPSIDNEMGLHLFLLNSSNNLWGHDGGEQGVATIMAFSPTTKVGAIILTNQGDADLDDMLVKTYELGLKL